MKRSIYSIYDTVSGFYQEPQVHINDDSAIRSFMIGCGSPTIPDLYLRDLELRRLGEFDIVTGEVIGAEPVRICSGDAYFIREYRAKLRKELEDNEASECEDND